MQRLHTGPRVKPRAIRHRRRLRSMPVRRTAACTLGWLYKHEHGRADAMANAKRTSLPFQPATDAPSKAWPSLMFGLPSSCALWLGANAMRP